MGSVQFIILQRTTQTGIVLVNAYFYHSKEVSDHNRTLLSEIGFYLCELGLPYIIAADFNMSPQIFAVFGWLQAVKGVIRAPLDSTCKVLQHNDGTTIDYVVLFSDLVPLMQRVSALDSFHG